MRVPDFEPRPPRPARRSAAAAADDQRPGVELKFWRGILFALPSALLLWALIAWVLWVFFAER